MLEMLDNFSLPDTASTYAAKYDNLFWYMALTTGFLAFLLIGALIVFGFVFRRRGPDEKTPRVLGSHRLEIGWALFLTGLFMSFFVWGAVIFDDNLRYPPDAPEINIVGKKWMWKVQYPGGQRDINQLHLLVNEPVKVRVTSEDVIHDVGIPAFRSKIDAVPGKYVYTWYHPTKEGTYHLFCDQYCGQGHSNMVGQVYVMNPEDYERWINEHAEGSLALEGRKLFQVLNCLSCHSGRNDAKAPVLANLHGSRVPLEDGSTVVADDEYIRESIWYPWKKVHQGWKPIMPTFKGQEYQGKELTEADMNKLIAYIKSMHQPGMEPDRIDYFPAPVGTPLAQEESLAGRKSEAPAAKE